MARLQVKHLHYTWISSGEISPKQVPIELQLNRVLAELGEKAKSIQFTTVSIGEGGYIENAFIIYEE